MKSLDSRTLLGFLYQFHKCGAAVKRLEVGIILHAETISG